MLCKICGALFYDTIYNKSKCDRCENTFALIPITNRKIEFIEDIGPVVRLSHTFMGLSLNMKQLNQLGSKVALLLMCIDAYRYECSKKDHGDKIQLNLYNWDIDSGLQHSAALKYLEVYHEKKLKH